MVLCLYMLLMKSNLLNIAYSLIQDIEDASPNLKNNLNEIYPIRFISINFKLPFSSPTKRAILSALDGFKEIFLRAVCVSCINV